MTTELGWATGAGQYETTLILAATVATDRKYRKTVALHAQTHPLACSEMLYDQECFMGGHGPRGVVDLIVRAWHVLTRLSWSPTRHAWVRSRRSMLATCNGGHRVTGK